jgi:integrase
MALQLKFVSVQRGRNGTVHYYFRRNGRRWPLPRPGDPPSEEFLREYRWLVDETERAAGVVGPADRRFAPGTFGALINDYLGSGDFRDRKGTTKSTYRRVLERLQKAKGHLPVRLVRRRHIRKMRDELGDTPGAANNVVRMLKIILSFAVDEEWIESNPAFKVPLLSGGEWRAWTDEECAAFERRWEAGTMQRRAYALALYTGQRRSDLVRMTRAHRKSGLLHVSAQEKTGEEVWIREHWELSAELALGDQSHMSLLTTTAGRAFDPVYFGAWFADAIEAAGLPQECVLHGLRKTAAARLAEAGCTEQEIMAVTGHVTSRMVAKYTKAASKKKQASAAILKLENRK